MLRLFDKSKASVNSLIEITKELLQAQCTALQGYVDCPVDMNTIIDIDLNLIDILAKWVDKNRYVLLLVDVDPYTLTLKSKLIQSDGDSNGLILIAEPTDNLKELISYIAPFVKQNLYKAAL